MASDPRFSGRRRAPRSAGASGPVQLRLFVDSSAIEVFADDGSLTLTEIVFPTGSKRQFFALAKGGKASLSEIQVWPLATTR
jgi:sucrose-6-phosphate hydrolase SacC (GH32 family)